MFYRPRNSVSKAIAPHQEHFLLNLLVCFSCQEPLNSGDDVSDEEDNELFDTENVVVCQYDKVRNDPFTERIRHNMYKY